MQEGVSLEDLAKSFLIQSHYPRVACRDHRGGACHTAEEANFANDLTNSKFRNWLVRVSAIGSEAPGMNKEYCVGIFALRNQSFSPSKLMAYQA
jgi:hypothetical protein